MAANVCAARASVGRRCSARWVAASVLGWVRRWVPHPASPEDWRGLGSGLASCHWEAALTAREASQRKQAGKWQDLTPATSSDLDPRDP